MVTLVAELVGGVGALAALAVGIELNMRGKVSTKAVYVGVIAAVAIAAVAVGILT